MADGYRHDFTEELEAVARGVRRLDEIHDPVLRDAVRAALGLRAETPGLGGVSRARMRRAILASAPGGPRLSDRIYAGVALLAAPAPYMLRALAVALVAGAVLAATTVTSADALPDDPLYAVKIAAEDVRLALAATHEDRAAVELSLAEHRLLEAERLAGAGRESATLVAASAYGSHLARAAAELAEADVLPARAASLVDQLGSRLAQLRARAAATARILMADEATALAGVVLAQVATTPDASAATTALRIAEGAASVATRLAELAEERAEGGQPLTDAFADAERSLAALEDAAADEAEPEEEPADPEPEATDEPAADRAPAAAAPARQPATPTWPNATRTAEPTSRAVGSVAFPTAKRSARPTPTRRARPTVDPSARAAAARAKYAAELARLAAARAHEAAKRTPPHGRATPKPTPTRRPSPSPSPSPTRTPFR